jgi:hypothetical protein
VVTISITIAAYEAIKSTLPGGSDAFPPERDERGGVRFVVDHRTLDRLRALRGAGRELQRRDPANGGGVT